MPECCQPTPQTEPLSCMGFDTGVGQPPLGNLLGPLCSVAKEQVLLVVDCWGYLVELLAERCSSMSWHCSNYPGLCSRLCSSNPADNDLFLHLLQNDWAAYQKLREHAENSFLEAIARPSMLQGCS